MTIVKEGRKYLPEDFDIAQFMRNYDSKKRKQDTDNKKKKQTITLADLPRAGDKGYRTFIKSDD
jgi:hypothetical protein